MSTTYQEQLQELQLLLLRASAQEAEHKARKAKAEADLAEVCLAAGKQHVDALQLPAIKGVAS
jgi:hypothetical protein